MSITFERDIVLGLSMWSSGTEIARDGTAGFIG